jgi:hypothetical protein
MNWYSTFWLYWSYSAFLPGLLCSWLRSREPQPKQLDRSRGVDTAFRMMMVPALFYYITDSVYIAVQVDNWGDCNFSYLVHHLLTLTAAKHHLSIVHYPWFVMLLFPLHCLLLMFPHTKWLGYVYVLAILYMIWRLGKAPWKQDRNLQVLRLVAGVVLAVALPLLLHYECKNTMENVA